MKIVITTLLFLLALNFFSQGSVEIINDSITQKTEIHKNELKFNIVSIPLGYPEITYERILSKKSAIGLAASFSVNKKFTLNYAGIAYYRIYFGKKTAAGFFIEANTGMYSVNYHYNESYQVSYGSENIQRKVNETSIGLGATLGAKFTTRKGWVGEFFIGGLKSFMIEELNPFLIYPRLGITIGKRF